MKKSCELSVCFAKNVQRYRKRAGLSQEKLAELIGLAPNTIWKIENCMTFPKTENIENIAQMLDVPVWQLFVFPDEKFYSSEELKSLKESVYKNISKEMENYFKA